MRNLPIILVALLAAAAVGWLILNDPTPAPAPAATPAGQAPTAEAEEGPALKGSGGQAAPTSDIGSGRYRIRGQVVNAEDEPLAGVRVEVLREAQRWPGTGYASTVEFNVVRIRARAQALLAGRNQSLEPVGAVVSDEAGRFEVRPVEAGSYRLYARPDAPAAGGFASAFLVEEQQEHAQVTLKVLDGAPLEGRVEDAAGGPLAALVRGRTSEWRGETPSGADGRFRFEAVPPGDVSLSVLLPTGREITGFSAAVPAEQPVVLRVPSGSSVASGTVSDPEGKPLAGALVTLYLTLPAPGEQKKKPALELAAKTDAAGRYALSDLPSGEVTRLGAVAQGFLAESRYAGSEGWNAVPLGDGAHATIDVTLRRGSGIHGRVTRKDDGTPIEGATLTLYYLGWHPPTMAVATTNEEGRYRFEGLDHGKFFLLASHPTHYSPEVEAAIAGGYSRARNEPPVELALLLKKEDQSVERDLALLSGRTVTGRVVDPDGKAVANADVYVKSRGLQGAAMMWGLSMMSADFPPVTRSAADGSFRVDGLAPRADWTLFARKEGFSATESEPVDLATAATKEVTLRLAPQCVLRGHVFDAEGQPLANQQIYVSGYTTLRGGPWRFTSEADGAFELHSLPAAQITLTSNQGRDAAELRVDGLKPGEVREGLELRFGTKVEVSGTVHDSAGKPVGGLRLLLTRETGRQSWKRVTTNADGSFRFDNVEPGRVRLSVETGAGPRENVTEAFEVPASDVAVTYDPPRKVTIEGVVLGPDGEPVERCSVGARSGDGKSTRSKAVFGGTFSLEVPGGPPYALWVSKPCRSDGTPLNVRDGRASVRDASVKVTVRLEAGFEISGRVLGPDDKGVANVVVVTNGGRSATSDVDGAWRLVGLAPEPAGLSAKPPAGFVAPPPIVASPGDRDVEFRLHRSTLIRGRVLLPEGVSLQGGQVFARWVAQGKQAGGRVNGAFQASGVFTVQGLPPEVRVSLEIMPFQDQATSPRLAPTTVEDVLSGRTDLEVALELGVAVSGTVVKADGTPFTEGNVSLVGNGRGWAPIGEAGTFRAEGLRPGTFDLRVFDTTGPRTAVQKVTAPAEGVRVVVADQGSLVGKLGGVSEPDSWGVRAVDPRTGEDSSRGLVTVNGDGTWKIGPLDADRPWIVTARRRDGTSDRYARSAAVEAGASDVRLTPKTGASIRGRVEREGRAVPQSWVRAQGPGWQSHGMTDGDGGFLLRGLPPGRYTLAAGAYGVGFRGSREHVETGATGVVIELDQPMK